VSTEVGHTATAILDRLDPEQRAVALALEGPVCVLAGAGTGKTRAITHRIAYGVHTGVYHPSEVLAVTFTTRAAGEMRSRLAGLGAPGVQARTFHSAALRQARYFWPRLYGSDLPALTESKLPMLSMAARQCRIQHDTAALRDIASEIEWAKVSNVRPEDYERVAGPAGHRITGFDAATIARVFAAYEEVKRERRRIDMEDVLLCAAVLLDEDERTAAEVRRQYRWFVVDEFQDVNALQLRLLDLWLGGRDDVCVVGDPAQTIYSFAGATADHLLRFPRRYLDAAVITLRRNYRSTPEVVATANALLAPTRAKGEGGALRSQRSSGPAVTFNEYPDEVAEAEDVAVAIRAIGRDVRWREIAVLFRVNAQSEAFEAALTDHDIPYVVRGVERFFERPEVRQAMTLMRGAVRAGEQFAADVVADVQGVLTTMGWSPQAPAGAGATRNRWESLRAVVGLAEEVKATDPSTDLRTFMQELERRAASQQAPMAGGVTLATLHAAKGLEWGHVFVTGVHEGTVPITYAATPSAVEEERRLLYVGMTRARVGLSVSWSLSRSPGGRASRGSSRFLAGVVPDTPRARRPADRSGRRRAKTAARCRVCQRPLGDAVERKLGRCHDCPSTYDEVLYERLRSWRTEQSAREKVPAYCVFTDATLTVIAETRPRDAAALVKVPGIGPVKCDKYGSDILTLCTQD
jgi:DNA helicase II / ATP-dependent DNA helicase PcrA